MKKTRVLTQNDPPDDEYLNVVKIPKPIIGKLYLGVVGVTLSGAIERFRLLYGYEPEEYAYYPDNSHNIFVGPIEVSR